MPIVQGPVLVSGVECGLLIRVNITHVSAFSCCDCVKKNLESGMFLLGSGAGLELD